MASSAFVTTMVGQRDFAPGDMTALVVSACNERNIRTWKTGHGVEPLGGRSGCQRDIKRE